LNTSQSSFYKTGVGLYPGTFNFMQPETEDYIALKIDKQYQESNNTALG
jgi:hypothetical protein